MGFGPTPENAPDGQRLRVLAFLGVLALAPLLFIGDPDWLPGPLNQSVWNLGHIALFGSLTLVVRPWRWLQGWRLWLVATATMLLTGALIEAAQSKLGREADWHDILRNLIGVWLILAWYPLVAPDARRSVPIIGLAIACTLFVIVELGSTGIVAARQFELSHQLPKLYNFDHEDPTPFWLGDLKPSPDPARDHGRSLRIELDTGRYSGASLINLPADWRQYKRLTITLYNPDQSPLPLTLRINDLEHEHGDNAHSDRYNTSFTLAPGVNTYTLALEAVKNAPRNRTLDMSRIHRLTVFAMRLPEPRTIYLLDLRLD
ncbi:VanZ family protein [Marinobacter sp. F4206]|uniref:succinyl-CoA synthetase subunit beta n=1 Tax=Marinobacter sp. F4206 TaxID=2861777 RepID=UPI001C5E7F23|nr:succinyl-CoA synthetase subunit beta [Marinobacter sp. F4206]MBW4934001.1 succinyl-CoA synthetase subunit beta [Marinobacter sp. F4206]